MDVRNEFPPVRACLFDMDGLLLDTEDLYTHCVNVVLQRYGKPQLPWSVKAKLQGRPGPQAYEIFQAWAGLPISREQYSEELALLHRKAFPTAKPLPGVVELVAKLHGGRSDRPPVHLALATSSHQDNFCLKTAHLADLFVAFPPERRILGDDTRLQPGRGKPLPDIFLLALQAINDSLAEGEAPVLPEECLVFEDSVPGVEAGRRAGMRVIWCPHPRLKEEYAGREGEVLAGRTGEAGSIDAHQVGQLGDGWAEYTASLESFPLDKYGIVIPPGPAVGR